MLRQIPFQESDLFMPFLTDAARALEAVFLFLLLFGDPALGLIDGY